MKKVIFAIPIVLCVLLLIVPILELIGLVNGLDFFLHSEIVTVVLQAVLTVGATVTLFVVKPEIDLTGRIFLTLLTPIALLNALCFYDGVWGLSVVFAIIWCGCAIALFIKLVPDSNGKATSAVFSVLIGIAFVGMYLVNLIYVSFFNERIVESECPSMYGTYVAEVGTTEGAFGTKTTIYIAKAEPEFKAVIGYYQAKPTKIYEGEEYEYKTAIISWLDDETVIINDQAYQAVSQYE